MTKPQPAPNYLGFAMRMYRNMENGLEPLAGFDEDDMREMDECGEQLHVAMSQIRKAFAAFDSSLIAAREAMDRASTPPSPQRSD